MIKTDRYKNNPHLPKAGSVKEYSKELINELMKCKNDPIYFAKKYFKIVHVDHGLIPFDLHEYQEEAIDKFQYNRNLILCASRQSGKTSVVTVILLHAALFNDNKTIGILANKGTTAREILKRIKTAYEYLPDFLKGGVKEWNKSRVEFENGSVIMAEASSSDNIRGQTLFLLYVDEHAFVKNWDEFSQSVLPTISSGKTTKMIFSSTPNGLNHFYYYVKNAREKKNNFALVEVPWTRVPGRDNKWKQETLETLDGDELAFAQEYDLEFQGSSGTLISGSTLKSLNIEKPIYQSNDKKMRQYETPKPGRNYFLSADVSRGKGIDYSAFSVIDVTEIPYRQVFVFRDNLITPTDFADVIMHVGTMYNEASVLIEINDLGQQVADYLHEMEYENIIYTATKGRKGKVLSVDGSSNIDRGLRTTKPVKNVGCSNLKLLVEQEKLKIVDEHTIAELSVFSKSGQSYQAEPGKHDDLVMGLVIFSWATVQQLFKDMFDTDVMASLREKSEEQMMEDLVPFGFIEDGHDEFAGYEDQGPIDVDDFESFMRN